MTEVVLATLAFYLLQLMLPNLIAVARGEIDAASLFGGRDEKIEKVDYRSACRPRCRQYTREYDRLSAFGRIGHRQRHIRCRNRHHLAGSASCLSDYLSDGYLIYPHLYLVRLGLLPRLNGGSAGLATSQIRPCGRRKILLLRRTMRHQKPDFSSAF